MDYFYSLISIHFLYTEEDQVKHEQKEFITISIHFLYTEEDVAIRGRIVRQRNFNPLPLYRGRPEAEAGNQGLIGISIHFLYTEEDLLTLLWFYWQRYFNPLPLYRGRQYQSIQNERPHHFNPLPLYRGRLSPAQSTQVIGIFQSTSSIQRKTETRKGTPSRKAFQSTSSIQRKTEIFVFLQVYFFISIHFLYTEEDQGNDIPIESHRYFNPLPLYRGRQPIILSHNTAYLFQSTSSIQRKTLRLDTFKPTFNISIHFLYTEEDFLFGQTAEVIAISIHFLYTEEDGRFRIYILHDYAFQSTSSIQRKTVTIALKPFVIQLFQSTSSIQRKTRREKEGKMKEIISIHFLYTEEDLNFVDACSQEYISIHFLYTEEDKKRNPFPKQEYYFNPLPLYRGRQRRGK